MIFHKADIEQDFEEMETDWKTGDYYLSGESLADLITVAIGSVEDPHYDFDAEAIPDFVAGFIYQLTGDNQMTEIDQCWTGGQGIVDDAEAALADIKAGHYIKGAEDLYTVIKEFPTALSTCKNMGDDLDKIEDWAKVFAQPGTLAKELSKNWLLHHKKVKADIAKEEADWSSENYFAAGEDTAAAIELLVPFKESSDKVEFDIMAVPDFAAGFLYGMVGDNHLAEFQTCFNSADQLMSYINSFISDLEAFHIISAFENFEKFLFHFQMDVQPCKGKNLSDDMAAIEQWAAIFKEPTTLVETLGKHWLLHQKGIKKDIAAEKADWAAKNYFKAGADIADAVTLAVGPIEKSDEEEDGIHINLKGDAEFVAGFVYGMVGDNHLTEIEQCYSSTEPLVQDVEDFLNDLKHLKFIGAIESFEKFVYNFQIDTAACHKMADDVTSIRQWLA